jgi:uncharacterized protein (DUF433 family)
MAVLDWSQYPDVESVPDRLSGAWVCRDTRLPVQTIFLNFEAGMNPAEIAEEFDIELSRIEALPKFAS